MLKKIICLMLGLVMVLGVLTSCAGDEDAVQNITDQASRLTTTLNMWVITESELLASVSDLAIAELDPEADEDSLTAEEKEQLAALSADQKEALSQLLAVNKAINKITKVKFKTKLNIKYLTEEQYYDAIEEAFVDHEEAIEEQKRKQKEEREAIKRGEAVEKEEEIQQDETVLNEYGIPELKYPEAADYQVDILFIGNEVKYRDYINNEWLVMLDDKLENSAMQIAYNVNKIFLEAAKYNSMTYAIPNNGPIGEYTYLCVKESEIERYFLDTTKVTSIYDEVFKNFMSNVVQTTGVKPLYVEGGKLDMGLVHYWSYDLDSAPGSCLLKDNTFSLYGAIFQNTNEKGSLTTQGDMVLSSNVLGDASYMNRLRDKLDFETNYVNSDINKASACIVKGGWELQNEYEKQGYRVLTIEAPRATTAQVFDSMFAIGAYTADEERAMEIVTSLNTNAELINLLQHGVESINYTLKTAEYVDESGHKEEKFYAVETSNNLYKMTMGTTGNTFLAYPTSEDEVYEWEYGKHQNLEASMYPTLGTVLDVENYEIDEKSIRIVNAVSARVEGYLFSLTSTQVNDLRREMISKGQDINAVATLILQKTGNDTTYVDQNGETVNFTVGEFAAALQYMNVSKLVEGEDLQSPYGLYVAWVNLLKGVV